MRRDGTPSGSTALSRESTGRTWETASCATSNCTSDDAARTLAFARREGSCKGMPEKHTFNVVIVKAGLGTGGSVTAKADRTASYTGEAATVSF